ncbi:MAG: SDR family NAD(P)-dependent oxidoreductase [FCB group bacterium]|jgi:NAD(P)-dependent dehydrogenase (short-subunit alcohol dehydrogenase family)|nr:SDR family NAD(P)-dependent oxidoreductase [FCB group bacterium]
MKLKPIEEQVVVVFGATSGIGRETALLFARRGAKVVAVARGKDGLVALVEEVQARNGNVLPLAADAASFEQVKAVADQLVAQRVYLVRHPSRGALGAHRRPAVGRGVGGHSGRRIRVSPEFPFGVFLA